ncbi:MAG TPA: oxygenase MpaB family protein, partial [Nocardioidaceae bacterium]|nr:oxygenase MpaB family protein [Nocardioidaceae bacterium]
AIYYGYVDILTRMHGPLDDATADRLYYECRRFGTTLQMPAEFWPADRAAFEDYWEQGLTEVRFDPEIRRYLLKLLRFKQLHPVMRLGAGQLMTWTNTGLLPKQFRDELGLEWSSRDELALAVLLRGIGLGYSVLPRPARNFPFNFFLWDFRRRVRTGKAIV